jgi:DUF1365 family protein
MQSAAYVGKVTHVRQGPAAHAFSYPLYMLYLDLDELRNLRLWPMLGFESLGLLSFRRRDYRGSPARPLADTIRDDVEQQLGHRPRGPVRLLTIVRSLGPAFNPVSFYYCFDADGTTLVAVVAEITNTPWGERHAYVVPAFAGGVAASFPKEFHVSPFLPMTHHYSWRLSTPGAQLTVAMQNRQAGQEVFRAHLSLTRRPLSRLRLLSLVVAYPLMSWRVLLGIYARALRLWWRGAPFFPHPVRTVAERAQRSEA